MAKIPGLKRLLIEDYPDQQAWIGRLIQPLNEFMENVIFATSKNLTFVDNINAQFQVVSVPGTTTFTATTTSASNSITNCSSTLSLQVGNSIVGPGIPSGTTITVIAGTTLTISANATTSNTAVTLVGGGNFPISFKSLLPNKPVGITVEQAVEDSANPIILTQPLFIDWYFSSGQVFIRNITGLTYPLAPNASGILSPRRFNLTLLVKGG